jgi:hypothetical protein
VQGHHFYGLKKKTLLIIAGKKKKRQWANVDMDYGERKKMGTGEGTRTHLCHLAYGSVGEGMILLCAMG